MRSISACVVINNSGRGKARRGNIGMEEEREGERGEREAVPVAV